MMERFSDVCFTPCEDNNEVQMHPKLMQTEGAPLSLGILNFTGMVKVNLDTQSHGMQQFDPFPADIARAAG